ncbi:MAG: fimbria/pilus outer membrane usher protein [Sphingobium sp.]
MIAARPPLLFQLSLPALFLILEAPATAWADLPPPPREAGSLPTTMNLQLELVVNDVSTGHVVPVVASGSDFLIDARDLREAHLRIAPSLIGAVNVSLLPGVQSSYDAGTQRLLLTVASETLPHQQLGSATMQERIFAQSSLGALINYDLYISRTNGGSSHANLLSEGRFFGDFGVLRTTISYNRPLEGGEKGRFTRYDTGFTYIDEDRVRTYEAGDLVTRTLPWAGAARIGGLQISRDFAVRPDIITYPLPSFSGTTAVPTAVDLFINGHRATSGTLQPGPFTISDVPYVTGAGEAVITTSDAQGRRISTSMPFYVASTLLRPGLSDFSFSAGFMREHYGIRNLSYGAMATSGAWRHGLTSRFTIEAQGQAARSLSLAGIGGIWRIGRVGVVDTSVALSRHHGKNSTQTRIGYQYNDRRFNLAAHHVRRSRDYTDLGNYAFSGSRLPREETQAMASLVLGPKLGTLGLSWIESRRDDDRFRLLSLSYSQPLTRNASLLLTASREPGTGRTTAMLQLLVSAGRAGTAIGGVERMADGGTRQRIGYSRSAPTDGGLGWRADLSDSGRNGTRYQADVTWRTSALQIQAGTYGGRGHDIQWGDVSGSLVLMDGGAFVANRINDSFVLVSTDGMAGIKIRQENQTVGVTDRNGHLLLPWVNAYYGTKFEIDPLDLPADVATPIVEQRAAARRSSGRIVHFPVRQLRAATVILHGADGKPLPPGTAVTLNGAITTHVGWGGILYFENISDYNELVSETENGQRCSASFPAVKSDAAVPKIGPLSCR